MGEIKKQSISNTLYSYIGALLGFLIIYFQPRFVSSSDIGLLRLLYSFGWMLAIVMPLGMNSVSMRYFPAIRDAKTKHHGFFGLLLLAGLTGAVLISFIVYLFKNQVVEYYSKSPVLGEFLTQALILASIYGLINLLTIYSSSLFKSTYPVFLNDVFTRVGNIVVILLFSFEFIDTGGLVVSYISIFLIQLILLIAYLFSHKAISIRIDWPFFESLPLRKILTFAGIMMLTSFASLGIKYIDQLMIGHYLNASKVGIYATSIMICAIMEIPFNSLDRISTPKISEAWHQNNKSEVEKIYEMSSRYMFFIGAIFFLLLFSGIDLIYLYLPTEYQEGRMAFIFASLSSLINLMTGVNSGVIMYSNKYYAGSVFLFILIVVACISNTFLIELYGITGAAISTLIAIGVFNILKYFYILKTFRMQPFTVQTIRMFLLLVSIFILVLLLPNNNPWLKAIIGSSITIGGFLLLNRYYSIIPEINKLYKKIIR